MNSQNDKQDDQNLGQNGETENTQKGKGKVNKGKNGKSHRTSKPDKNSIILTMTSRDSVTAIKGTNTKVSTNGVIAAYNSFALAYGHPRVHTLAAAVRRSMSNFGIAAGNAILAGISYEEFLSDINSGDAFDESGKSAVPAITTTNLAGAQTYKAILARLYESKQDQIVHLPMNHGEMIDVASFDTIKNYLAMIALRRAKIVKPDWKNLPVLATLGKQLDQTQVMELDKMFENSVTRYMTTNVIQPLLRFALVSRAATNNLDFKDIRSRAHRVAQWTKAQQLSSVRTQLQQTLVADLQGWEELDGFINLQQILLGGVPQVASVGVPLLLKALKSERTSDNDFSSRDLIIDSDATSKGVRGKKVSELNADLQFDLGNFRSKEIDAVVGEDELITHNPYGYSTRSVTVRDTDGNVVITNDTFEAYVPEIKEQDIVALLIELAKLKGKDFSDVLDLTFTTRYPKWSGVLLTSQADPLSDKLINHLQSVAYYQSVIDVLNGKTGDQSLLSVFDESNRTDLQAITSDRLSILTIFTSNYTKAIIDILSAVSHSKEYGADKAMSEIVKYLNVDLSAATTVATNETTVVKVRKHASDVYLTVKNSLIGRRIYFHSDLKFLPRSVNPFIAKMKRSKLVGSFSYIDKKLVKNSVVETALITLDQYRNLDEVDRFLLGKPDFFVDNRDELSEKLGSKVASWSDEIWDRFRIKSSDESNTSILEEGFNDENYMIIEIPSAQILTLGLEQEDIIRYTVTALPETTSELGDFVGTLNDHRVVMDTIVVDEANDLMESFDVSTLETNFELMLVSSKKDAKIEKYLKVWESQKPGSEE